LLSHEDALESKQLAIQSGRLATQSHDLSLESKRLAKQSNELSLESQRLAEQSNNLASDSQRLATKTMEDSSAMKTIAVMTMLFLPGTFFAALFALPQLQWTESKVIQKSFWIYWAFTIPVTALVFVVWNILTSWTELCDWCRKVMSIPERPLSGVRPPNVT
jgi:Mg2+ and Co2+ transporter CorA